MPRNPPSWCHPQRSRGPGPTRLPFQARHCGSARAGPPAVSPHRDGREPAKSRASEVATRTVRRTFPLRRRSALSGAALHRQARLCQLPDFRCQYEVVLGEIRDGVGPQGDSNESQATSNSGGWPARSARAPTWFANASASAKSTKRSSRCSRCSGVTSQPSPSWDSSSSTCSGSRGGTPPSRAAQRRCSSGKDEAAVVRRSHCFTDICRLRSPRQQERPVRVGAPPTAGPRWS